MSSSSSSSTVRTIAVAQLQSGSNKFTNLLDIAKCAGWAKRDGACMLFLPENFGFFGESSEQTLQQAEPPLSQEDAPENPSSVTEALREMVKASANGSSVVHAEVAVDTLSLLDGLKAIARESDMWITGGGMQVSGAPPAADSDKPRVYNTQVIVDNTGKLQSYYRKVHLFDAEALRESATTAPGTELVLCDSPIGKLGLTVCYDLRFPEMYIELAKRGAQIMLVPAAFTVPTGSAHWHTLLRGKS
jgi:predicted amidohydrolase